jgi:hypothetical protein
MATPDGSIAVERHRDLVGRSFEPWIRRLLLLALLALVVLALADVFGQVPSDSRVAGPAAVLSVHAPQRLRGGLLYEARFTIEARRDIKEPQLVLGSGWLDGMTINTVEPAPTEESSRDGDLEFTYDELAAGETMTAWIQFQVNPTTVGRRVDETELRDGDRPLLSDRRPVTVWP